MYKKLFLKSLIILSSLSLFSFSVGESDLEREIELLECKDRPTKSLVITPDINAYKGDGFIRVEFKEAVDSEISLSLTSEIEGLIYSDVISVNASTNHFIYAEMDETDSYVLEITGKKWKLKGLF